MQPTVIMGMLGLIIVGWAVSAIARAMGKGNAGGVVDFVVYMTLFTMAITTVTLALLKLKEALKVI